MSGYLDTGYVSSAVAAPNGFINQRVFDNVSGTPQLQTVNLQASYTGTFGGKIELNAGQDANILHSYPQSLMIGAPPFNTQVDITQAYLSYSFNKFTLIGGKFSTLAGAEVLESPSDLEFSRSILFAAIPITHTGLRLTYAATPQINLILGANRGWDTVYPLTAAKSPFGVADTSAVTIEAGAGWTPSSAVSVTAQGYTGNVEKWAAVGCAVNSCSRSLADGVATWHITSNLTAIVNGDYATQTKTASRAFVSGVGTVTWEGVAGYLSYAFSPKVTVTGRAEYLVDQQGYLTGLGFGTTWDEGTLTLQYAATPNLTVRLEGRGDSSKNAIFVTKTGFQKTNVQFGAEAIVHAP
jgi:Putative beta-barrel porin-2, OmpL-like. bbp2